jgi:phosphate transport system substrate-binding protein
MKPKPTRRRRMLAPAAATLVAVTVGITGAPAGAAPAPAPLAAAVAHGPIEGSGSSWSANAVNQWIADVDSQGLQVVFTASGSAQGRKDFGFRNVDYAVTDIPFQGTDPISGEVDSAQGRPFAYLPIVAGGTAFPYQIRVAGKLVQNLRLSGEVLAKIFTNQITMWNDPLITRDNNGRTLPAIPIIPVVHSEGSGSTAQFTTYLAKQYPSIWAPYNAGQDRLTEYYPRKGNQMVAQNGSDGVMNFIGSAAANGAIGYDEYSYALNKAADGSNNGWPVAKIENTAGYFTLPDQYNVAKSLTQAIIDTNPASPTYLIQKLDNVYVYNDPRTYSLSSYSYMILPTGTNAQDPRMTTAKRQTLTDFLYYAICTGQREMGPIGYSPLPVNLVQAGFDQVQKLKTADPAVDITRRDVSTCNNPTFVAGHPDQNYLAQIAPMPLACDRAGAGPCAPGQKPPAPSGSGGTGGGTGGTGTPAPGQTPTPGSTGPAPGGSPGAPGATPSATVSIDPNTGQIVPPGGGGDNGGTSADGSQVAANLAASEDNGLSGVLTPLVVIELLAILVVPVLLHRGLARRRDDW